MLINGKYGQQIAADDRGLLYGDGVFTTIAVRAGQPQYLSQHLARLQHDSQRLGIPLPDAEILSQEALELCANKHQVVLKIIITRGSGGRGYRSPEPANTSRILSLHPWPEYPSNYTEQGVRVRLCKLRLGHNLQLAGIKHLNRLEQVLARSEWNEPEIAEGLLLDEHGHLIEATMSNVFLLQSGRLLTPTLDKCGVAGIMRARVLELARQLNIPCMETELGLEDVARSEAMFLCNSIIGIWPVRQFDQQAFIIDPLIHRLQQAIG